MRPAALVSHGDDVNPFFGESVDEAVGVLAEEVPTAAVCGRSAGLGALHDACEGSSKFSREVFGYRRPGLDPIATTRLHQFSPGARLEGDLHLITACSSANTSLSGTI